MRLAHPFGPAVGINTTEAAPPGACPERSRRAVFAAGWFEKNRDRQDAPKQRNARALLPKAKQRDPRQRELFGEAPPRTLWQARYFNVGPSKKRVEKLKYMHRNPVKRGLVESPEQWRWSSYRFYLLGEIGPVKVNVGWSEISFRDHVA